MVTKRKTDEEEVGLEAEIADLPGETEIDGMFDTEGEPTFLNYFDWLEQKKIKARSLRQEARRLFRAIQGWHEVRTEQEWADVCEQASEDYYSGRFFLEQLGAERYLDPKSFATLWQLRNGMIEQGYESPPELIVLDLMLISYSNALRVQGWIGDLALSIEREFFDDYGQNLSHRTNYRKRYGEEQALMVESQLRYLRQGLLPLFDRCNRAMLRNMRMLRELRYGPAPRVAIGKADQVNVASQQVNAKT